MDKIEYRTEHRLTDSLALQAFILRHHLMRRALYLAFFLLVGLTIATLINGAPLSDSLEDLYRNIGFYVVVFLVGLAVINIIALLASALVWRRRPKPRLIEATITPRDITIQKDGFSYSAHWADADFLRQDSAAYLMKFRQLYMRLPKRGFSPETEISFRGFVDAAVPVSANDLGV